MPCKPACTGASHRQRYTGGAPGAVLVPVPVPAAGLVAAAAGVPAALAVVRVAVPAAALAEAVMALAAALAAARAAAPAVRAAGPAPASRVPAALLDQHLERGLAPSCRALRRWAPRAHGNDLRAPGDDSQPGPPPTTRRQTCIDVLCAYPPCPNEPDPGELPTRSLKISIRSVTSVRAASTNRSA